MNHGPCKIVLLAPLLLVGCASGPPGGERTVFHNPYAPTATASQNGIGPQCDVQFGRDATCLGEVVATFRRGRIARLSNGETIRLTRNQARLVRERAELLRALREPPVAALPPAPLPEPAEIP